MTGIRCGMRKRKCSDKGHNSFNNTRLHARDKILTQFTQWRTHYYVRFSAHVNALYDYVITPKYMRQWKYAKASTRSNV